MPSGLVGGFDGFDGFILVCRDQTAHPDGKHRRHKFAPELAASYAFG
ncbi:hypothetical protein [uncultured Campylobacter sp.]|nr:hypothetical protein [uncultured Campylobacter sp.]